MKVACPSSGRSARGVGAHPASRVWTISLADNGFQMFSRSGPVRFPIRSWARAHLMASTRPPPRTDSRGRPDRPIRRDRRAPLVDLIKEQVAVTVPRRSLPDVPFRLRIPARGASTVRRRSPPLRRTPLTRRHRLRPRMCPNRPVRLARTKPREHRRSRRPPPRHMRLSLACRSPTRMRRRLVRAQSSTRAAPASARTTRLPATMRRLPATLRSSTSRRWNGPLGTRRRRCTNPARTNRRRISPPHLTPSTTVQFRTRQTATGDSILRRLP